MPYAKIIRTWDGTLSVDSQAGPIYEHWLGALQNAVYAPHAPKERAQRPGGQERFVEHMLQALRATQ